jgi:N-glycosylase/DNA lyase
MGFCKTYNVENFDIDVIANSGQVFRWERDKHIKSSYHVNTEAFDATITQVTKKVVTLSGKGNQQEAEHYFTLDDDYKADYDQALHDMPLRVMELSHGMRIINQPFFEAAVTFVISGNNNIPRIKKSVNAIADANNGIFPSRTKFRAMIQDRDFGTGYRWEYLKELADNCPSEAYLTSIGYDAALKELICIANIGIKVANCICLYGLGYKNAAPVDVWVSRALNELGVDMWKDDYAGLKQQLAFYWMHNRGVGYER